MNKRNPPCQIGDKIVFTEITEDRSYLKKDKVYEVVNVNDCLNNRSSKCKNCITDFWGVIVREVGNTVATCHCKFELEELRTFNLKGGDKC